MKITILCENMVSSAIWDAGYAEWGFSALIERDDLKVLFDFGTTDVYVKNAKILGIDLETVDFTALSHHHIDHLGGIRFHPFKSKKKLIAHHTLKQKCPAEIVRIIDNDFDLVASQKVKEFAPGAFFLGEVPRVTEFEHGKYEEDQMEDDTAICFKTDQGTVVVTGCSHSGICNICEYAKLVTGQRLYAVIGGFHLFDEHRSAFEETLKYFEKERIPKLMPMHCVDFALLAEMQQKLKFKKYSAGDVIEI